LVINSLKHAFDETTKDGEISALRPLPFNAAMDATYGNQTFG